METKTENTIFIGFHITPEMDQWIRMNAVAKNIPVSKVLREQMEKWKDDSSISEKKLIAEIVGRIQTDLAILHLQKREKVDVKVFMNRWKMILSKKLATPLVNQIIKEYEKSNPLTK